MARYDADGCRVPSDLFEAAAWHYVVVAICRRCARETVFDPHALWWKFERKGWDYSFRAVSRRFRCTKCGAGAFLTWSKNKAVTKELPMPSESEWKRAINRFRS